MQTANRVFGLDLIRTLAISFVVISHSERIIRQVIPDFSVYTKVDGVTLFFVLSGFLIGRIIYRVIDGSSFKNLYHFYNRRWWRTLPNYYLFFLLHIIFYFSFGIQNKIDWSGLLFLQNLFTPLGSYFRESWSLAVEEWFYFIFPLGWWFLLKMKLKKSLGAYLTFTIVVLALAWIYKGWFFANHTVERPEIFARLPVVFRISSIMWGVLLGIVYLKKKSWFTKGWPWLIAAVSIWWLGDMIFAQLDHITRSVWKYEFKSVLSALFIAAAFSWKSLNSRIGRLVNSISVYSYSMYLINLPFLAIWRWFIGKMGITGLAPTLISVVVAWLLIYGLSALTYHQFESNMTRFRVKES